MGGFLRPWASEFLVQITLSPVGGVAFPDDKPVIAPEITTGHIALGDLAGDLPGIQIPRCVRAARINPAESVHADGHRIRGRFLGDDLFLLARQFPVAALPEGGKSGV